MDMGLIHYKKNSKVSSQCPKTEYEVSRSEMIIEDPDEEYYDRHNRGGAIMRVSKNLLKIRVWTSTQCPTIQVSIRRIVIQYITPTIIQLFIK